MPRRDGTGPQGAGAMTGRRAGYCAGFTAPGFAAPVGGVGMGRGCGGGFARRRGFNQGYNNPGIIPGGISAPTKDEQISVLKNQASYLENTLKGISEQLAALEKSEN